MKTIPIKVAIVLLMSVLCSCGEDNQTNTIVKQVIGEEALISADLITTITGSEVSALINESPELSSVGLTGSYADLSIYRVVYATPNYDGSILRASGLAIIPRLSEALPILSYQHGTILSQSEIPSVFRRSLDLTSLLTVYGGLGYAVSAPDYIGYGESRDADHPFEHNATMGSSSFDMLMATRELVRLLELELSDKLFLGGYSQGGYATMSLHRHIEENSSLEVTMSAPGAGSYNKSGTVTALSEQEVLIQNPGAWLWNIYVINRTSSVNRSWAEILTPDNLALVETITDPMTLPTISGLDNDPRLLFTASFISGLEDGSDAELLEAFRMNDNHDWDASFPITLYYGTDDTSVFPFHALTAFEALDARGAPVGLVAIQGADHNEAVLPYWKATFELFESLR